MTIEQTHPPEAADDNFSSEKMTCLDIGLIFAREYYTFLNRKPSRLHAFYGADSLFVRGAESESVPILKGQEEIRKRIKELDFDNCKVLVTQVDSQVSSNDGILISVLGEISNKERPSEKFAETFFLAPQPNGYYILNNIFRFLKDKVDIDYYICERDEVKGVEEANHIVHKLPETMSSERREIEIEVTSQTPAIPSSPSIEVEEKNPIESDGKPVEYKKRSEDKKPFKEKKFNEPKLATMNNKSAKDVESVTTKKEKTPTKNGFVNNKKVEGHSSGNNSPFSNGKEQTSNKHNEIITSAMKDHNNKNNQKGGVGKPVITNTTTGNTTPESTFKSWAKLVAPTSPSVIASEKVESEKPFSTNNNPQDRTQLPQTSYSPKSYVHTNINQEQPNISYSQRNQSNNVYNYTNQQQQMQHQPNSTHQFSQQQNQYRKETQIFVKDVNSTITEEQLEEAFSKFGPVKSVKILHNKNCGFIDYGSIESTQKALEQHKVMIGGNQHVYAEERRPSRYFRPQVDNRRYQQNRRGGGGSGTASRGGGLGGGGPLDKRGGEQK